MIQEVIKGKAFVVCDDVDTDVIIPGRYLTEMDPKELGMYAMEDLDPVKYPIPFLNPDTTYSIYQNHHIL